jgi:hypothetical protein
MSTNINITVGGNGLLQQSAQFTQANRQAQLQRTSRAAAERQGVTALQQERIAQGRDPVTGAPLAVPNSSSSAMARFGPSRTPRIDQQPAASPIRTAQDQSVLLYPRINPTDVLQIQTSEPVLTIYFAVYPLQVKGKISNSLFSSYSSLRAPLGYFATGGPYGQSYLKSDSAQISRVGFFFGSPTSQYTGELGVGYPYTASAESSPSVKTFVFDADMFIVPEMRYAIRLDFIKNVFNALDPLGRRSSSRLLAGSIEFIYTTKAGQNPPEALLLERDSTGGNLVTYQTDILPAPALSGWTRFTVSKDENSTTVFANGQKFISLLGGTYPPFATVLAECFTSTQSFIEFTGQTIAWSGLRFTANKTITGDTYAPRSILRPL